MNNIVKVTLCGEKVDEVDRNRAGKWVLSIAVRNKKSIISTQFEKG
jgi:hypothetical protein